MTSEQIDSAFEVVEGSLSDYSVAEITSAIDTIAGTTTDAAIGTANNGGCLGLLLMALMTIGHK